MRKKIVFVNQSSGYLMVDIVNRYVREGYDCSLITGLLSQRNSKLDKSVRIHKTISYKRSNIGVRFLSWVISFFQSLFIILFKYKKSAYIFYVSNPPLNIFIPLFTRNSYSFLVYDIYPNSLIAHKYLMPDSMISNWWNRKNVQVYKNCDYVFTISESMKKNLSAFVSENKIHVIPVWADTNYFDLVSKSNNPFLTKYNLKDKFIVLYSGNLGITHDLEILVDVANQLKRDDIFILIIGRGEKEKIIRSKIERYNLKNCILLPLQPIEMLPYTLGAADIGVVSLDKASENLSIPSKTYSLIAAGKPLLCIANPTSDLAVLVEKYSIGKAFESNDVNGIINFICSLADDENQLNKLIKNTKEASVDFSSGNTDKFVQILNF